MPAHHRKILSPHHCTFPIENALFTWRRLPLSTEIRPPPHTPALIHAAILGLLRQKSAYAKHNDARTALEAWHIPRRSWQCSHIISLGPWLAWHTYLCADRPLTSFALTVSELGFILTIVLFANAFGSRLDGRSVLFSLVSFSFAELDIYGCSLS